MTHPAPTVLLACLSIALAACAPAPLDPQAAPATPSTPSASPAPRAPAPTEASGIPAAFLGEWNSDPADCGTSRNDSRLVIEPARIVWWESSGPVTGVQALGDDAIQVTAQLSGEGETWNATTRFTLRDRDTLVAAHAEGGELARVRCPTPSPP